MMKERNPPTDGTEKTILPKSAEEFSWAMFMLRIIEMKLAKAGVLEHSNKDR